MHVHTHIHTHILIRTHTHTHSLFVVSLYPLLCVPTSSYRSISNNNSHAGWVFGLSLQRGMAHLSNRGSLAGVTACLNMGPISLQARSFSQLSGSSCASALSLPLPRLLTTFVQAPRLTAAEKVWIHHTYVKLIVHKAPKGIISLIEMWPRAGRVLRKASHAVLLHSSTFRIWNSLFMHLKITFDKSGITDRSDFV